MLKACPRCRTSTPVDTPTCAACGHVYRTQFTPPDRTQLLQAPVVPADTADRTFSLVWTWIGLGFACLFLVAILRSIISAILFQDNSQSGASLLILLPVAFAVSWLALRLRKLAVYTPTYDPTRSRLFTTLALSLLIVLCFVAFVWAPKPQPAGRDSDLWPPDQAPTYQPTPYSPPPRFQPRPTPRSFGGP